MNALKLRRVAIDTYRENVAFLHRQCPLYHSEGFQALNKIEIPKPNGDASVIATLNIADGGTIIEPDELGLSEQTFEQLGEPEGTLVSIYHATPPLSLRAVHRKIAGYSLTDDDLLAVCQDIIKNRFSKIEIAAFLVACAQTGMERDEMLGLTRAMVATGDRLDWGEPQIVDKHCIGGVPGNRTTMIIVPIVAAHGMLMPKTSSLAITSPAGTADTMEMLACVDIEPDLLQNIARQHRGFIAWGGKANLAPVDDILISVERPLAMDSVGQMIASILSKKIAAGSTHLLIDIPVGPTAKVRSQTEAMRLKKLFEYVGDRASLMIEVVITDGRQPIGHGIGPALEVRDVMQVLENNANAPMALKEKALQLAGRILEFDPDVRGGQGYALARDLLESGRALEKMLAIITAQGARELPQRKAKFAREVTAKSDGLIRGINNYQIAQIARLAGAPTEALAGVDLYKRAGDAVTMGEPLYEIYAEFPADFEFAVAAANRNTGYELAPARSCA